jgi:hypothetical protein
MKKYISVLFLCLIPYFVSAEAGLITTLRTGNWNYIDRLINFSHVQGIQNGLLYDLFLCNKSELRIIRNAFYARHGYIFNSQDLREFFTRLDWYNGTKENVDADLSDNEKSYIELISRIENNYPARTDERIVGYWADEIHMPYFSDDYSNYSSETFERFWYYYVAKEHFRIYPNGTFYYKEDTSSLLEGIYGLWSFNNNVFTIMPLSDNQKIFGNFSNLQNKISRNIRFREYISYTNRSFLECNLTNNAIRWIKYANDPSGLGK